jgi:putative ABC transport system substrate-binding protein
MLWGIMGCHAEGAFRPSLDVRTANSPRRAQVPMVVVLSQNQRAVLPFQSALRAELAEDFDVWSCPIESAVDWPEAQRLIEEWRPVVVVLVDNPTAVLYRNWAANRKAPPAAILVMSAFVEELQPTIPNSVAVAFESPAVTSLVAVRSLLERRINRVGVLYREHFGNFIERQRRQLAEERITLVSESLTMRPSPAELRRGLRRLRREGVDALWVTNDNVLLSKGMLASVWLPFAERYPMPIVVGVPTLVGHQVHFGLYAAAPDIEALGVQTADLVIALSSRGYHADARQVLPPLAARTYVDWELARNLGAKPALKTNFDIVIGGDQGRKP